MTAAALPSPRAAIADVACSHCSLPVPRGLLREDEEHQFCCAGCRSVFAFLHDNGLDRYYDLADGEPRPAATTGRSYTELDDATFHELHCTDVAGGGRQVSLYLEGVHCTACVWLVEKLPALVPGVIESRLDLGRHLAVVTWRPDKVELSTIARFVDAIGYPVHPYRSADRDAIERREERRLLVRIAVAAAVAGNVMLMAAAMYAGMFGGISAEHETFFRWLSMLVTVPAVFYSGSVFFRGAFGALRARALHMDLPISIGIAAGFGWGAVNTVRGAGEIYFDTVAALVFLLLIGRWIQLRQQRRAASAAEILCTLTPTLAHVVENGVVRDVAIEAVTAGTIVEVRAGETFPVDGRVVAGRSAVDSSVLTGESRPASIGIGADVCAGCINLSALVRVAATETGEQTRMGRLMASLAEHANRRAPIVRMADRLAAWFVIIALGLAAATVVLWSFIDASQAIEHAVALLIVTCPCALGLATPLAVSVAIGRAARRGILIKGGDTVERLARPGHMVLDKTGTLTRGEQTVVRWAGEASARPLAAALERHSAHPVARAIVADVGGPLAEADDVEETTGAGVTGLVEGQTVAIGSPAFIALEVGALPDGIAAFVDDSAAEALTPIVIAVDGRVVAAAALGDPIRDDARATLDRLRALGWRVSVVSGDHPEVVASVGRALGVPAGDCVGGATPEDKVAFVTAAAERGSVVMVGDGVNDSAALAAAGCGVAVHGSAEASLAAADVFITRPGVGALVELVRGARRTVGIIRRNLIFSLGYNVVGATLAITGIIHPLLAAVLMPASSVTVVTSSIRGRTFGRRS